MIYVHPAQNDKNEDFDLVDASGPDQVGTPVGVKRCLRNPQDSCRARRRKVSESESEMLKLVEEVFSAPNEAGPSERVEDKTVDLVRHLKLEREAGKCEGDGAAARDNVEAFCGAMNEKREQMAEMHHGMLASIR